MEKYLTLQNLIYVLIAAAAFALYKVWKSTKEQDESQALLEKLNSSSLPATTVVDNFAAERNIVCTRFQVPAPPMSAYSQYLTVFLGDNEYHYFLKSKKWILE